jgi:protein-tyrosine phosphatase
MDEPVTRATDRHLPILGTRNLRDIGGYDARDGRRTRWGTLFRSDHPEEALPPASQQALIDLGIRTVIDVRSTEERDRYPNVFQVSDEVTYRHLPMREEDVAAGAETLADIYSILIDQRQEQIVGAVRALTEPGALPALLHCAAGRDRTGIIVALALSAVGVDTATIVDDYGLSDQCYRTRWTQPDEPGAQPVAVEVDDPAWRLDCPPEAMSETLEHVDRAYGGARAYLLGAGLGREELERLEEVLTEPTGRADQP